MADKFEFKKSPNWISFDGTVDAKKKPSLMEYKQVIIELSEAVNQLSKENQMLKGSLTKYNKEMQQMKAIENEKQNEVQNFKKKIEMMSKGMDDKDRMLEQLKIQNSKLEKQLKTMTQSNYKLQISINNEVQKKLVAQKFNETSMMKIKVLEQNLEEVMEINRQLNFEYNRKNEENQLQVRDLKEFNQELRRKFQTMEIENLSWNNDSSPHFEYSKPKEFETKEKRSFSTEKKVRKNAGFLSTNINLSRKALKNRQNDFSRCQNVRPFTMSLNNPQLGSELQNLKKEIAHQYTLLNLKNENYSKQRVNRTLEELKRKMGKAILVAEQSESQSIFQP